MAFQILVTQWLLENWGMVTKIMKESIQIRPDGHFENQANIADEPAQQRQKCRMWRLQIIPYKTFYGLKLTYQKWKTLYVAKS